ncbi:ATP-binding cassette domain-containing protein [Actinomyces trachealis]|uniref:ATP-binding cassette domain-containing protein n=1 Tax=Actinomyces trachealis TaxID=2763540 RepID=UPI001892C95C|nr:ATP-binding cassette domain-containing protein [Actinomyces trachealis]
MVSQDNPGLDELSAVDNVLLGLAPNLLRKRGLSHSQARREALEILERVGITDPRTRLRHMSGGERQRVSLARAMLAQPRLTCLDEPTSALDHTTATQVLDLVREHAAAGNAVLVAAHDPLIIEAADLVIDMAQYVPLS